MNDTQHPAMRFADTFKELAEGRFEPEDWLAWWAAHEAEVETACPRGWFLRLKMSASNSKFGIGDSMWSSQGAVIYVLEALKIPFQHSDRYKKVRDEEVERFLENEKTRKMEQTKRLSPRITLLSKLFPKFARFLKKRIDDIDELDDPASEIEIDAVEKTIGGILPEAFKQFLKCTRRLSLDGFSIGLDQVFKHPALVDGESGTSPSICIAEYWLEADGDQVLLECCPHLGQDPPVYYYAHAAGTNKARSLAPSFSSWIESLPKSEVFKR